MFGALSAFQTPVMAFKTRNRNALSSNTHQKRSLDNSQHENVYLFKKATVDDPLVRYKKAKKASEKATDTFRSPESEKLDTFNLYNIETHKLDQGQAARKRTVISIIFELVCGAPPKEVWAAQKVVVDIMHRLKIPEGSRRSVITVMEETLKAIATKKAYDASAQLQRGGRPFLIFAESKQALAVLRAMKCGLSISQATVNLNEYRVALLIPLPAVSWGTVEAFVNRSDMVESHRRQTKKSGSEDEGSAWSQVDFIFVCNILCFKMFLFIT
jgi:hypothetical protein